MEGLTRLVDDQARIKGVKIGPWMFKIHHFADDTFAWIESFAEEKIFDKMLKLFFDASNMKENFSKKLGLGPKAHLTPRQLPGYKWCPIKSLYKRHLDHLG